MGQRQDYSAMGSAYSHFCYLHKSRAKLLCKMSEAMQDLSSEKISVYTYRGVYVTDRSSNQAPRGLTLPDPADTTAIEECKRDDIETEVKPLCPVMIPVFFF